MSKRNHQEINEQSGQLPSSGHRSGQGSNKRSKSHHNPDIAHSPASSDSERRPFRQENEHVRRQSGSKTRSEKIARLLEAVDDVLSLDSENGEQSMGEAEEDIISKCEKLRRCLQRNRDTERALLKHTEPNPVVESTQIPNTDHNTPKSNPFLAITPWNSSSIQSTLPSLPTIHSPDLETATFTHSGLVSNSSTLSYERLEWIGDAYLYVISTTLISTTFASHLPGKCAQIREMLVKNETLASYARAYGFEKRARLPGEYHNSAKGGYKAKPAEKTKVLGDIFEAYVAAVVLSDPTHGVDRVVSWLKALWAQTISAQILEQERKTERNKTKEHGDTTAKLHPKERLAKKIVVPGIKLLYRDVWPEKKDPATGHAMYTVGVYLDGWGEQNTLLGKGTALGKKEAGAKAAEMALNSGELLGIYEEKKREHEKAKTSNSVS